MAGKVKLKEVKLFRPALKGVETVAHWNPNVIVDESKVNNLLDSIERNHILVDSSEYRCNAISGKFKEE